MRELIAATSEQLTPTERRIAEAVLDDPTLLAFGTVSELAERVDTSRPSIVRFAHKLGFSGFPDLQRHAQDDVSRRLARPSDRIRRVSSASETDRHAVASALDATFQRLTDERIAAFASPIAAARAIWVLSGETSRAGGHAVTSGLTMLREHVQLVEDHAVARTLNGATAADAAVVIDFYRYRRTTQLAARALAERGVTIVAITDGALSPLASLTELWCEVSVPGIGPFDTSVPAVAVAEVLVAEVARHIPDAATASIDRTEDLWEATETFRP